MSADTRDTTKHENARIGDPSPVITLNPKGFQPRPVRWGHPWQIGTAHYWIAATHDRTTQRNDQTSRRSHHLGSNLIEEVAACLLGGHGMPYEIGLAAYRAVRDAGLLEREATPTEIEQTLRNPLHIGDRSVRYRFPAQRSKYLSHALTELRLRPPPQAADDLRRRLLLLPGIGPKTASWIVRNHLGSDQVAIIDIHIFRAGVRAGVFDISWTVRRDYTRLEAYFLAWAHAGSTNAADLDATIWAESAYLARGIGLNSRPERRHTMRARSHQQLS